MIVRKLRLQRGWSQEQLAEMTGLSARTIQRIERGQKPSLESARAMAAVFEVDLSTFDLGEPQMNEKVIVTDDEQAALAYVKQLKEFYTHALLYVIFGVIILWDRGIDDPVIVWGLLGWTAGIIVHGLVAFEKISIFGLGPTWERRMVEKRLGRKL
ncbi:MAG: helix-turn-helix domain-containing protein [Halieaceae bacterium]